MSRNILSMLLMHNHQTYVWSLALWHDAGFSLDRGFKNKLLCVKDSTEALNKHISRVLSPAEKQSHEDYCALISRFSGLIAQSSPQVSSQFIDALEMLANNSLIADAERLPADMLERVDLISELTDKLLAVDLKELRRIHKQILNKPLKKV